MTFFSTIGSNQHLTFFSGGKLAEMVNVHEAKTHLSRLLEEVHAGKEIILAKGGRPYARLLPLEAKASGRQPGRLKGALEDFFLTPCLSRKSMSGKTNEAFTRHLCVPMVGYR